MRAFPPNRAAEIAAAEQPSRPLRVCMMVTYDLAAPCGGVKHHAQQLAAALRRRGDTVTIVGPASAPIADEHTQTFRGVMNIRGNGSDNMLGLFVRPWQVAKFFRANRFDVIHIHEPCQPSLSYWSTWLTRKTPHVATFHAFGEADGRMFTFARKTWGRTIFPFFQRAIAVSEPAARYASVAWKRPLSIIPNGVPTDIFTPNEPALRVVTDRDRAAGPVKLLFVGRIGDSRKGAPYMFDAYRMLIARGLPVSLDVVGELGSADAPPELPGLTYHGAVNFDRLVQLYRDCDVFVAPSTGGESFGIVLLEAMSSGKPVVCTDIDGYRELTGGTNAILVPPRDPRSLADAVARIVATDGATRARMGAANRMFAKAFDWDRIATLVRAEYSSAIRTTEAVAPV